MADLPIAVRVWFESVFMQADLALLDEVVTPNFRAHAPAGGGGTHDQESFADWLRWYRGIFRQEGWAIEDVVADVDRVVVRYRGTTTYTGGVPGAAEVGRRVVETGMLLFRLEGERIAEVWSEMSDLQAMQQLGVLGREVIPEEAPGNA